jgi:hypothetical protein
MKFLGLIAVAVSVSFGSVHVVDMEDNRLVIAEVNGAAGILADI